MQQGKEGVGLLAKERIEKIRQLVTQKKKVTVSGLSELLGVTEETIRKDLTKMEEAGIVTRIHGGAVPNTEAQREGVHFFHRLINHLEEKRAIADKVQRLLDNKYTIFADSSTTVAEALKMLPSSRNITVVTNSTEAFRELAQSEVNVISTGGEFNKNLLSLQGNAAKNNLSKYHVDIALLSCRALDRKRGVQDSNEEEAEMKKIMIRQAGEVALLVDHSKFDRTSFVSLMELGQVNYIVTDRQPNEEWVAYCEENQIKLIY